MYLCTKFDAFVQICTFIPLTALTTSFFTVLGKKDRETFQYRLSESTQEIQLLAKPDSGRGQGHESNFYIVDLENFATASRRYSGDIHNSTVVGLFMTPIDNESDSKASRLSVHVYYTSAHLNRLTS